jgi:hypothetical protein
VAGENARAVLGLVLIRPWINRVTVVTMLDQAKVGQATAVQGPAASAVA